MLVSAALGWVSFWTTYWVTAGLLPYDDRSLLVKPSQSVPLVVARNMLLSLPYGLILWYLCPDLSGYFPTSYIIRFFISVLIMDGWFYLIHRLLHTRYLYSWHKQHHQFNVPYPLVAVYCSSIEALLCDVTSMGLGPILLRMAGLEIVTWMVLAALHSLLLHSSWSHGRDHGVHHGTSLHNFGLLSIFDRVLGTYQ